MADYRLWHWHAITAAGTLKTGVWLLDMDQNQDILTLFIEREYKPIHYWKGKKYRARDWKWAQKVTFMRQLAALLKAGVTLSDGLRLLAESHPELGWQALLQDLHQKVEQGTAFSEVLQRWPAVFPSLFPSMMRVGELTGRLDLCCLKLAEQQEKQQKLNKKVIKSLRYPFFILFVAFAVLLAMLLLVLPEFVSIYNTFNAPLPKFTRCVIRLSEVVQQFFLPFLPCGGALWMFWYFQRERHPEWQRREQRLLLRLPIISRLWRDSMLSHIFTTLALTQAAGLTLLEGLNATEKTIKPLLWSDSVSDLQFLVKKGMFLHQAISRQTLFTPLCGQLIKVGEESGSLDELLIHIAHWYENSTLELTDSLSAMLEPLMILVVGVIVGALVIAMYLPIFSLGEVLGKA